MSPMKFIKCTSSLISKLKKGPDKNDESGESDVEINEDAEDNEIGEEGDERRGREFLSILICGAVRIKIL
jgi:hypothetical protein